MAKLSGMLDSGAFTAHTQGTDVDIDEYIAFVKQYDHLFTGGIITLDVIGDGEASYRNWHYMRKAGIDAFPVYHLKTDEKWLEKYLKETDRIGLGVLPAGSTKAKMLALDYLWKKYLLDGDNKFKARIHGLGLTALSMITRYPWDSIDSSASSKSGANGRVLVPGLAFAKANEPCQYSYDPNDTIRLTVSGWSASRASGPVFHSLPPIAKEAYAKYFADRGWSVRSAVGVGRPLRRREKRELMRLEEKGITVHKYAGFSLLEERPQEMDYNDLAQSWRARYGANLDFWEAFQAAWPSSKIYHATPSTAYLHPLVLKGMPLLVSYYYLTSRTTGALNSLGKQALQALRDAGDRE